jgi:metal-responsive CopG/Arc/MetJ family transcriptional regulator
MSVEESQKLEDRAHIEKMSKSDLIRKAIIEYLERAVKED